MKTNKYNYYKTFLLIFIHLIYQIKANDFFKPVSIPNQLDFPLNFSSSDNKLCKSNSVLFANSLSNYTLWAYRMWDASAKISVGLTEGSEYQLGDFDECISIKEPFKAQYCLATIYVKLKLNGSITDPFSLKYKPYSLLFDKIRYTNDPNKVSREKTYWGICVPSSCQAKDVENELKLYLNKKNINSKYIEGYTVDIDNTECSTETNWLDFDVSDYLFCGLIVVFLVIIVICTMIDSKYISESLDEHIRKKKTIKYLLCFSAKENFKDLTKAESSNDALQIIYGLRVFMIFSIVLGHSYNNILAGSVFNLEVIEKRNRSFENIFNTRGELLVDLFFALSGLLNTYSYLVQSEKKTVSPIRIVILRYTRLAPVFALVTYFYASIFDKLGSGPLWNHILGPEKDYCVNNWWTNILFLDNYLNTDKMCILQGWFLATDYQLGLLAIPLNLLIKRNTKICWIIVSSILIIFIIIPFLIVYYNNLDPLLFIFNDFVVNVRKSEFFRLMYIPTHTRASSFIIGMIIGYIYFRLKDAKFKLSSISSIWLCTIGTFITMSCLFSGIIFYNPYVYYQPIVKAAFAALVRPAFAIGCGLVLFVTSFGKMPLIKQCFRWKIWIPFAKLSFSVYMVHWAIQLAHAGVQRTPMYFNYYYLISQVIVELTLSYALALILFVCVENPCSKFMKYLLPIDMFDCKSTKGSQSTVNILS